MRSQPSCLFYSRVHSHSTPRSTHILLLSHTNFPHPSFSFSSFQPQFERPQRGSLQSFNIMPPQIFKNKVIAVAGPLPGQLNHDNLKRWTENRRGRFSETFDEDVTHLLCTRAQFRQRGERGNTSLAIDSFTLGHVADQFCSQIGAWSEGLETSSYCALRLVRELGGS